MGSRGLGVQCLNNYHEDHRRNIKYIWRGIIYRVILNNIHIVELIQIYIHRHILVLMGMQGGINCCQYMEGKVMGVNDLCINNIFFMFWKK